MKLTKIHIFLILLLALVLCSTLGMCSNQGLEGFSNISDDKRSYETYNDYSDPNDDDDDNDRYNMNTKKPKYSDYRNEADSNVKIIDRTGIFDSVAKGKMNASMYNIKDTVVTENDGVPKSRIPPGQEHLYILKSEIVPPICPACPSVNCNNSSNSEKKCQPCPPCARCPEPSFECKKVPNYNSRGLMNQLPIPWADKL
jgi:hypothetical protein